MNIFKFFTYKTENETSGECGVSFPTWIKLEKKTYFENFNNIYYLENIEIKNEKTGEIELQNIFAFNNIDYDFIDHFIDMLNKEYELKKENISLDSLVYNLQKMFDYYNEKSQRKLYFKRIVETTFILICQKKGLDIKSNFLNSGFKFSNFEINNKIIQLQIIKENGNTYQLTDRELENLTKNSNVELVLLDLWHNSETGLSLEDILSQIENNDHENLKAIWEDLENLKVTSKNLFDSQKIDFSRIIINFINKENLPRISINKDLVLKKANFTLFPNIDESKTFQERISEIVKNKS